MKKEGNLFLIILITFLYENVSIPQMFFFLSIPNPAFFNLGTIRGLISIKGTFFWIEKLFPYIEKILRECFLLSICSTVVFEH
jgi:hypothetical protein